MTIKIVLLLIYFAILVIVGIFSRRKISDVNDFVLGGRSIGPWMTAFAYGTTYFSAVVFVGYAGQFGWKYGISSFWIGIGNALIGSLLAWIVLGRRTRIMTNHLSAATMPSFFCSRFDSNKLKIVASAIIFIFLIPYTASVYNGLSLLFGMAFNIPYSACLIIMAALTCLYVIMGGYIATAWTDFIQGIIMLFGIVLVIGSVLAGQGGFTQAIQHLSAIPCETAVNQQGVFTSFFGPDPRNLLGVVVLTSLGAWGMPQMVHKFYAISSEKVITTGAVISTVFAMIVAGGCYFLGGFGRLFDNPSLHDALGGVIYDSIVPYMLSTLPNIVIGIVLMLVLSASMSTLSSLVLTSSSTLTLDFIKPTFFKNMSSRTTLLVLRLLIAAFIVISVIIALNKTTFIAQLMGISWGALAGSFLGPLIWGLYWKKTTPAAIWACFVVGVGITVTNLMFGYIASPINAGALAILLGMVIVPVVSLISKKMPPERVKEIFSCYDNSVVAPPSQPSANKGLAQTGTEN